MPPFVKKIEEKKPTALGVHIFAGGFTVGVKAAGFNVLAHLEDTDYGVATARANWPDLDVRVGSENWSPEDFAGRVDFLYANPPCAIFSVCGVSLTKGRDAWRNDPRTDCWYRAFWVFETVKPKVFACESVCQAYTKGRPMIDDFTRRAVALGYSVVHLMEDAKWAGVPQSRKRFFFVAYRPEISFSPSFDFSDESVVTVADSLAEARLGPAKWRKISNFDKIHQRCIEATPQGGRLRDAYDQIFPDPVRNSRGQPVGRPGFMVHRLREDEPMGVFVGDICIHPTDHRFLNESEMLAVCGYPQDFQLRGSPNGWGSQLGRAVMPGVGQWLASTVRDALTTPKTSSPQTVTFLDLRVPGRDPEDLTNSYIGDEDASVCEDSLETAVALAHRLDTHASRKQANCVEDRYSSSGVEIGTD